MATDRDEISEGWAAITVEGETTMTSNPTRDDVDALIARLRGQDAIPNRNEVADAIAALREQLDAAESELRAVVCATCVDALTPPAAALSQKGGDA